MCVLVLTQEQATRQIDKLFGADSDRPRLWREISEVPGLLDQKQKSDVSHIKNLFVKRGRLVYRDPSVAKDRRPNPRGSPHRLSFSRLVEVLGDSVRSHIENFDWEAYGAYEKDVFDERSAFNRRIRATIGKLERTAFFGILHAATVRSHSPTPTSDPVSTHRTTAGTAEICQSF